MTTEPSQRVLVFAEYGWLNGGENSLLAVVPGLRKFGWDFVFACPGETEISPTEEGQTSELAQRLASENIRRIEWDVRQSDGSRKPQDQIRAEIAEILQQSDPDIVHCNSLATGRLVGPVTCRMGIASLGYLRDIIKLSRQAIADLNQLDTIVSVSQATRDFHIAQGMTGEKVHAIYNGVDLEKFAPREPTEYLHDELEIPKNSRIIVCVGQIGLRKATDVVIRSFIELCSNVPQAHLLLIGMRNSQKLESIEFEQHCRQLGFDSPHRSQIHWLGRRSDMAKIMNEADLLLHAARQEPLGRVLLEASASGCPFVATDVGGTSEIVGECYPNWVMCDVDSPSQMAAAAVKILTDCQRHHAISTSFRENACTRFRDQRCATDLDKTYRTLLP